GSPFNVTVKGTPRSHPGIYHCCTFCSSGGQKDARCGCGGTMPGRGHRGQGSALMKNMVPTPFVWSKAGHRTGFCLNELHSP
ncbi:hypothetical protein AB205_0132530, partial [Aquarana catesbeiana]